MYIVRPGVFWRKYKSGRAHPTGLGPEDCDDFRGADVVELLAGQRIIVGWVDGQALNLLHAEEDVDTILDRVDRWVI